MSASTVSILFIGDIMGDPGRKAIAQVLPAVREQVPIDLVIANAENAAGGFGITKKIYDELLKLGVQVMTSGNHIWDKKEFLKEVDACPLILRPANYPPGVPGQGSIVVDLPGKPAVAVLNLMGRVFMPLTDCPFRKAEEELAVLSRKTKHIFVDMHGEATSEKVAMGWFLDGRVSAVVGTHTHVQTADERILPQGTAYLTDVGLTGPYDSVIGVEVETILTRFKTQISQRYHPAKGPKQFCAVHVDLAIDTGKARSIRRFFEQVD